MCLSLWCGWKGRTWRQLIVIVSCVCVGFLGGFLFYLFNIYKGINSDEYYYSILFFGACRVISGGYFVICCGFFFGLHFVRSECLKKGFLTCLSCTLHRFMTTKWIKKNQERLLMKGNYFFFLQFLCILSDVIVHVTRDFSEICKITCINLHYLHL